MDLFDIGATVILGLILLGMIGFWLFSVKMKNRTKRVHRQRIHIDEKEPGFYHFLTHLKSRFPAADISFVSSDRTVIPHPQFILYKA